jgi:hypothetical protein
VRPGDFICALDQVLNLTLDVLGRILQTLDRPPRRRHRIHHSGRGANFAAAYDDIVNILYGCGFNESTPVDSALPTFKNCL